MAKEPSDNKRLEMGFRVIPNFHVIITLKTRKKDLISENLTESELLTQIVNPIKSHLRFGLKKELISFEEIKHVKITTSNGFINASDYGELWNIANSCEDVTLRYLDEHVFAIPASVKEVTPQQENQNIKNRKIFIVHGRDLRPVTDLKKLLISFGLEPIVLYEQPGGSRTIVEKLEKYSDVGYAFIVLTPDDVGYNQKEVEHLFATQKQHHPVLKDITDFNNTVMSGFVLDSFTELTKYFKERARQNVVLEFGFFIGILGRSSVCCLYKGDVDLPSDMTGILYIPFKKSIKEISSQIIKELKDAGYKIELA